MDQDAFRNLLSSSRQSLPNDKQAINNVPQKGKTSTSQPAFKPRKVKKPEGKYRDRAAERREGTGNDYAQVEAVLEDFEKRAIHEDKDVIEQQRKYLGGDSQHTILVKGLDMSLLEQNRARTAASVEDDEVLEQAFAEAISTSETTEPKKRTREDIVRDLKAKRQNGNGPTDQPALAKSAEESSTLEVAKQAGKFKPIGFKPIGQPEEKMKKRKIKEGKDGAKKKKKVESAPTQSRTKSKQEETSAAAQDPDIARPPSPMARQKTPELEPTPLDENFDIFAGAGDYEGFPADEDSEEEHHDREETKVISVAQMAGCPTSTPGTKGWFDETEPEIVPASIPLEKSPQIPEAMAAEEESQEMHLKPLESSALPSIRDFLAMDEAAEKAEKRKARKEKKKKKKKADDDDD